jgi:hypothetical protein
MPASQCLHEDPFPIRRPEETALLGIAGAKYFHAADIAARKTPAKRNQGRAATRQRAQRLSAPCLARRKWIDRDRCHRRSNAGELLPAQPADLVELVHPHVNEDAAAAGVKLHRRRFAIPLVAGQEIQRAHLAIHDTTSQALQRRHEASPIGDLEFDIAAFGDRCRLARLLRRDAAGLLAKDRQPGIRNLRHKTQMQRAWRRHQDAIEPARL